MLNFLIRSSLLKSGDTFDWYDSSLKLLSHIRDDTHWKLLLRRVCCTVPDEINVKLLFTYYWNVCFVNQDHQVKQIDDFSLRFMSIIANISILIVLLLDILFFCQIYVTGKKFSAWGSIVTMRIDLHDNEVTSCDLFLLWWRISLSDDIMKCRLILIFTVFTNWCVHLLKKILLFNFKNWNINSYSIRSCDQVRSFWKSRFDEFLRSLKFRMSSDFAPYVSVSGWDSTILLMRKEIKRSGLRSKNSTIKWRFRKTKNISTKKITNQFVSSWATRLQEEIQTCQWRGLTIIRIQKIKYYRQHWQSKKRSDTIREIRTDDDQY